jgi:hypothetical protein
MADTTMAIVRVPASGAENLGVSSDAFFNIVPL